MNGMMAKMMSWSSPDTLLAPRGFIILNGAPSLHLLNYPFCSLFARLGESIFGGSLDFWGRFQSAFFIFLAGWIIYRIARHVDGRREGFYACALFSFSPMVLITGTSFQNEAFSLFAVTAAYAVLLGASSLWRWALSGFLMGLAVLSRVHFAAFVPACLALLWQEKRGPFSLAVFLVSFALPVLAWCGWVYYLDLNVSHIYTSLFGQLREGRVLLMDLLKTRIFYERIFETLTGLWMTPIVVPFLIVSFFRWEPKRLPLQLWVAGCLTTLFILPQKVYQHPFYLAGGVVGVSLLAAPFLARFLAQASRSSRAFFWVAFLAIALRYYVPPALSSREEAASARLPEKGRSVHDLTREGDLVVAAYRTSAAFLYYSDRLGWGFYINNSPAYIKREEGGLFPPKELFWRYVEQGFGDPIRWLEYLRTQGAHYFAAADREELNGAAGLARYLNESYARVPVPGDSFVMYDLTHKNSKG